MPLVRNFIMFSRNCFKSKLQIRHFSPLRITWLCWQPAGIHLSNRITTSWRWKMGQKQEECLFLKVKGKRANQEGMEALGMGKTKQSAVDLRKVALTQHSCGPVLRFYSKAAEIRDRKSSCPFFHSNPSPSSVSLWDFEVSLNSAGLGHLTPINQPQVLMAKRLQQLSWPWRLTWLESFPWMNCISLKWKYAKLMEISLFEIRILAITF